MSLPHAVIIAGGSGERLGGVRKADLRIGGRRLLDRVIEALGAVEAPVILSMGRGDASTDLPPGVMTVADLHGPTGGPLAGLAAAVAALRLRGIHDGLLVSAAVDTPFLPPDFASQMRAGLGEAPAAFARWDDQFYPPNAIWRIESVIDLPERVAQGHAPTSLKALLLELNARAVEWRQRSDSDPFANLNTVGHLVALGRRARDERLRPLIHMPGN